jgi:alkanesulfonate monooxygenase SsuD/methylene tetrahydromethanopterin reductase-like flavin-dependent oxidoreductase (luciferase family)
MEFGLNFNGDMDFGLIKRHAGVAEKSKFAYLWIGDSPFSAHSFSVLCLVSESTKKIKIGSGIISPLINRCMHIKQAFRMLREVYGERYAVALAPGDMRALERLSISRKNLIEKIEKCGEEIKDDLKVFIGASGPKMIEKASEKDYPLLLNYGSPEYLEWALKHRKKKVYCAAYAPSLILNRATKRLEKRLLIASAVVLAGSNKKFQEEFGLEQAAKEVKSIIENEKYEKLGKHKKLLLERFSITGTAEEVKSKCEKIKALGINQIIFATPFGMSKSAITAAGELVDDLS